MSGTFKQVQTKSGSNKQVLQSVFRGKKTLPLVITILGEPDYQERVVECRIPFDMQAVLTSRENAELSIVSKARLKMLQHGMSLFL